MFLLKKLFRFQYNWGCVLLHDSNLTKSHTYNLTKIFYGNKKNYIITNTLKINFKVLKMKVTAKFTSIFK